MNVCEEHKIEREARGLERTEPEARRSKIPEREACDENEPAKRADFLILLNVKFFERGKFQILLFLVYLDEF